MLERKRKDIPKTRLQSVGRKDNKKQRLNCQKINRH
ncbi:hypothetical protein HT094_14205 [Shewanella sp. ZOR0012]|nr:hypothetical protein [Shewanella sp. ZOR0012]